MNNRILYVPLEGYKERYTMQWSAPLVGWLERNWRRAGIEYVRIEPLTRHDRDDTIKTGSVVDAVGRSIYAFNQVAKLLGMAERGEIKDSDVIFFDDFWTPGLEALPYAFHLLGIRPRMYAFLHAQSVDEFDFTHGMRYWMRPVERGFANALDGIFVCCPTLRDLVCQGGGISDPSRVHVTGHPFSSEEVMERMPAGYRFEMGDTSVAKEWVLKCPPRKNQVIWSSRWDEEKNPLFFLKVAKRVLAKDPSVKFVVCTSAPRLRSNNERLLTALRAAIADAGGRIELREGLTKEAYYAALCESKVQFNCASQDFVAITLLEASVAGCFPVYPYFRSFPETFLHKTGFMYQHLDEFHAAVSIKQAIDRNDLWTPDRIKARSWIHSRFDTSWVRMLVKMGVVGPTGTLYGHLTPTEIEAVPKDPFNPEHWQL